MDRGLIWSSPYTTLPENLGEVPPEPKIVQFSTRWDTQAVFIRRNKKAAERFESDQFIKYIPHSIYLGLGCVQLCSHSHLSPEYGR